MSTAKFNEWQNPDGTENYKTRAWVNFNGTGVVAIRASGNVASITDNGTGDYTVNFATAMVDANFSYSITGRATGGSGSEVAWSYSISPPSVNNVQCVFLNMGGGGSTYTNTDVADGCVSIIR